MLNCRYMVRLGALWGWNVTPIAGVASVGRGWCLK